VRVVVGRIGKAHGIRGEVTVEVRTDEPGVRFAPGSSLFVAGTDEVMHIDSMRPHGGGLLIGFDGVTDRNAAELLRGILLEADRPQGQMPADEDEFYDSDLIGCAVRDVDGVHLGTVCEVVHLPAQDLLAIREGDDPEWLLPLVRELVLDVDLDARLIIAQPPAGLIDVDRAP
jgi:16S rRNA processing protein RimM